MNELLPAARAVFQLVLAASGYAAVLAVLVIAAERVVGRLLAPRQRHTLWMLVVVRLVLPVAPESPCSAFNALTPLWENRETSTRPVTTGHADVSIGIATEWSGIDTAVAARGSAGAAAMHVSDVAPNAIDWLDVQMIAVAVWLGVVSVLAARTGVVCFRFWWATRSLTPSRDTRLTDIFRAAVDKMGIRRRCDVYITRAVDQPAVMGLVRPRLLLPPDVAAEYTADELEMIFVHELAHVKRWDIAVNWALAILRVVHWFNPAIFFAARRIAAERELACDAAVLRLLGHGRSRQYGHLLLRIVERTANRQSRRRALPVSMTGMVHFSERTRLLKERISMLKVATSQQGHGCRVLACGLVLGLAVLGLTDAAPRVKAQEELPVDNAAPAGQGETDPGAMGNTSETNADAERKALLAGQFPFGLNTRVTVSHPPYSQPRIEDDHAAGVVSSDASQVAIVYDVGDLLKSAAMQEGIGQKNARAAIERIVESITETERSGSNQPSSEADAGGVKQAGAEAASPKGKLTWFGEELVVIQTQETHERIANVLDFYRANPLRTVASEMHFLSTSMKLNDSVDNGEYFSWNIAALSEEQAQRILSRVEMDAESRILSQPKVTFLNGQWANITVLAERSFPFTSRTAEGSVKTESLLVPVLHDRIEVRVEARVHEENACLVRLEIEQQRHEGSRSFWGFVCQQQHAEWLLAGPLPSVNGEDDQNSTYILAKFMLDGPLPHHGSE